MTLICTYNNKKDLLEKEQERLDELDEKDDKEQDIEELRIRCNILEK